MATGPGSTAIYRVIASFEGTNRVMVTSPAELSIAALRVRVS